MGLLLPSRRSVSDSIRGRGLCRTSRKPKSIYVQSLKGINPMKIAIRRRNPNLVFHPRLVEAGRERGHEVRVHRHPARYMNIASQQTFDPLKARYWRGSTHYSAYWASVDILMALPVLRQSR